MISTYRMALLQALDFFCILLALAVSGMLSIAPDLSVFHDYTGASLFTVFFYLLFFYILDAYSVGSEDFRETMGRVLVACLLGIVSSATASYAFQHWRFDRETVVLLFALSFCFCLGWRLLYYCNADKITHPLRILLVGVDRAGKVRQLLAEGLPKAEILGYVGERDQGPDAGPCLGAPFLALDIAQEKKATMILLLPDAPIDDDIAHDLLEAKLRGSMVVDIRSFYEHVVQRLPLSQITDEWLLQNEGFSLNTRGSLRRLKRVLDMLISLMLLIPATPVMLLTALIVRLESPGPVIYRQERGSLFERNSPFTSSAPCVPTPKKTARSGPAPTTPASPALAVLSVRSASTRAPDLEYPQGRHELHRSPPERMAFVQELKKTIPYYSVRHSVKPGLTGWAPGLLPYGASAEDARRKTGIRPLLY